MNLYIIIVLLLLIFLIFISKKYLFPILTIITGFACKSLASGIYVAKRDPNLILKQDLSFSLLRWAKIWTDDREMAAYSSFLGLAQRKAIYRPGLGCTLVHNNINFPKTTSYPPPAVESKNNKLWPVGDRLADANFSEIDYNQLRKAVEDAFDAPGNRSQKHTRAVLVVYKNKMIAEKYASGFNASTPQLGWSITKSITNAMIGLMVKNDLINIHQPTGIEAWQNDNRKHITIHHLLQMASGLKWKEKYGALSDATKMLYHHGDKALYAIQKPLVHQPGKHWVYASGSSNILQKIMRDKLNDDIEYWKFPYEQLFQKINMSSATMEVDASGTFVGSSYSYATPRDWARFGLLYLNNGVWNGERILPAEWIKYTVTKAPASKGEYGAHFWLNQSGKYPSAPRDMFLCQGFHGQRIFILPSRSMVIVRLGRSKENVFDFDKMLKGILGAFK